MEKDTFNVIATYSFTGSEEGDLPFLKDDVLTVTETDADWYTGYKVGSEGVVGSFPVNRTRLEEDNEEDGENEEDREEEEEGEEQENDETGGIFSDEEDETTSYKTRGGLQGVLNQTADNDGYEDDDNNGDQGGNDGGGEEDDDGNVSENGNEYDEEDDEITREEDAATLARSNRRVSTDDQPNSVDEEEEEEDEVEVEVDEREDYYTEEYNPDGALNTVRIPESTIEFTNEDEDEDHVLDTQAAAWTDVIEITNTLPQSTLLAEEPEPQMQKSRPTSTVGVSNKDKRKTTVSTSSSLPATPPSTSNSNSVSNSRRPSLNNASNGGGEGLEPIIRASSSLPIDQIIQQTVSASVSNSNSTHTAPGFGFVLDDKTIRTIAKLVDARLLVEFTKRDDVIKDLRSSLNKIKTQMNLQSNTFRAFVNSSKSANANGSNGGGSRSGSSKSKSKSKSHAVPANANVEASPHHNQNSDELQKHKNALSRYDHYTFSPNVPRVASIPKKNPSQKSTLSIKKAEHESKVVRYAETRSAVYEPTGFKVEDVNGNVPDENLRLEYVHGYSGRLTRTTNAKYLPVSNELVFPCSALVVVHDTESGGQRFYREHNHDVMCIAVHPFKDIVASGQVERKAFVLVYSTEGDMDFINELSLGPNTRGVKCLDFSPDGKLLLATAADMYNSTSVWNWVTGQQLAVVRANNNEVYSFKFSPVTYYGASDFEDYNTEYTLVSSGSRHIKFWTLAPDDLLSEDGNSNISINSGSGIKEIKAHNAKIGKYKMEGTTFTGSFGTHTAKDHPKGNNKATKLLDILCVTFKTDVKKDVVNAIAPVGRVFCGAANGCVYVFTQDAEDVSDEFDNVHIDPAQIMAAKNNNNPADGNGDNSKNTAMLVKPVKFLPRGSLIGSVKDAHGRSPIMDMAFAGTGSSNILASVSKDGMLNIWKVNPFNAEANFTFNGDAVMDVLCCVDVCSGGVGIMMGAPRSVCWDYGNGEICVGTSANVLIKVPITGVDVTVNPHDMSTSTDEDIASEMIDEYEIDYSTITLAEPTVILRGHAAQIKQIATHPTLPLYISVGEDKMLSLYTYTSTDAEADTETETEQHSTLVSSLKMPEKVYCVAFHPNGEDVAIGLITGDVYVKKLPVDGGSDEWGHIAWKRTGNKAKDDSDVGNRVDERKRKAEEVAESNNGGEKKFEREDIKNSVLKLTYSPNGATLVAACRDYYIYVFSVPSYRKSSIMKGHSTFVTQMDYSSDSSILQSNDAAKEILYWDVNNGKQIANGFELRDTKWSTWSCVFGWSVQGIHNFDGGNDILSVSRSSNSETLAIGDGKNNISLFRYPALKGAVCKSFASGHMSSVCSLDFSHGDRKLVSTGGIDCAVFLWGYGT